MTRGDAGRLKAKILDDAWDRLRAESDLTEVQSQDIVNAVESALNDELLPLVNKAGGDNG